MTAVSRRALLAGGGALGAGAVLRGSSALGSSPPRGGLPSPLIFHSPDVQPFRDRLPVPAIVERTDVTVTARSTLHRFHRDWDPSPALAYGEETYLGPTLISHRGQPWRLTTRNRIGDHPFAADVDHTLHGTPANFAEAPRTTTHLHGGVTPPADDGHPLDFVAPGEQLTYRFPTRQQAGHLWYHDHSMGTTRLNVYAGLAGMNLVRDRFDTGRKNNPLGLPVGEFEVPLILQEKIFKEGGVQSLRSTPIVPEGNWEGGAVGDVGVVNGKVWPELEVARGLYRFRIINAASFSVWRLFFSNRMRFWVIGNDAGLLDAPVRTRSVQLGPAERIDVLVDFSGLAPDETVELRNDLAPAPQAAALGEVAMPLFCRFRATRSRGFRGPVPQKLRGGRNQPARLAAVRAVKRERTVTVLQLGALRMPPALMSLNNLPFTTSDIERPRQGTTEIWNIVNVTGDPHAIHLHLTHFRVLDRQALNTLAYRLANPMSGDGTRWTPSPEGFTTGPRLRPPAWERGPKDTVVAEANSVTRIVAYWPSTAELGFDPNRAYHPQAATARQELSMDSMGHSGHKPLEPVGALTRTGKLRGYLWHCHMLDHEDHEMMLPLRTVAR